MKTFVFLFILSFICGIAVDRAIQQLNYGPPTEVVMYDSSGHTFFVKIRMEVKR